MEGICDTEARQRKKMCLCHDSPSDHSCCCIFCEFDCKTKSSQETVPYQYTPAPAPARQSSIKRKNYIGVYKTQFIVMLTIGPASNIAVVVSFF